MMIYKIMKNLYKQENVFALCSVVGDTPCYIKPLSVDGKAAGYYIYNGEGAGIAQITFSENRATLAIARSRGFFPGSLKVNKVGKDKFEFDAATLSQEDEVYAKQLGDAKVEKAYSVWGKPTEYSYDIYYGSDVAASVIRVSEDDRLFQIKVEDVGNFLMCLMIILAVEKLSAPQGKHNK